MLVNDDKCRAKYIQKKELFTSSAIKMMLEQRKEAKSGGEDPSAAEKPAEAVDGSKNTDAASFLDKSGVASKSPFYMVEVDPEKYYNIGTPLQFIEHVAKQKKISLTRYKFGVVSVKHVMDFIENVMNEPLREEDKHAANQVADLKKAEEILGKETVFGPEL